MTEVPAERDDRELPDVTSARLLSVATESMVRRQSAPRPVELVSFRQIGERQRYVLEERIAELELRLRERSAADDVHELELRSMQLELDLKAAYVTHLETAQGMLHQQLAALEGTRVAREADLNAQLGDLHRQLGETRSLVAAIEHRRAYRLMNRLVGAARFFLAPAIVVRRRLRRRPAQ